MLGRRTTVLGAAVGVALALVAGTAQAATIDLQQTHLKRGADARVAFADMADIHTRGGRLIPLPETNPPDQLSVLGRSSLGWVAWRSALEGDPLAYDDTLYAVTPQGGSSVLYDHSKAWEEFDDFDSWYALSDNGKRYVEWLADEGDGDITVRNLAGEKVGHDPFATSVVDFTGPRMAFLRDSRMYVWRIGHTSRLVTRRPADFADLDRNVIFLRTPDGRLGPTKLSKPRAVRWKAPFEAVRLSPDGTRVVGRKVCDHASCRRRPVFQIRRMDDGKLLTTFRTYNPGAAVVWESNRAVLVPLARPSDHTVAVGRCTVSQTCNRASPWLDHGPISFPRTER